MYCPAEEVERGRPGVGMPEETLPGVGMPEEMADGMASPRPLPGVVAVADMSQRQLEIVFETSTVSESLNKRSAQTRTWRRSRARPTRARVAVARLVPTSSNLPVEVVAAVARHAAHHRTACPPRL